MLLIPQGDGTFMAEGGAINTGVFALRSNSRTIAQVEKWLAEGSNPVIESNGDHTHQRRKWRGNQLVLNRMLNAEYCNSEPTCEKVLSDFNGTRPAIIRHAMQVWMDGED